MFGLVSLGRQWFRVDDARVRLHQDGILAFRGGNRDLVAVDTLVESRRDLSSKCVGV